MMLNKHIAIDSFGGCRTTITEEYTKGTVIEIDPVLIKELIMINAELRHTYENLVNGYVTEKNMKEFADALLSRQIKRIDKIVATLDGLDAKST